MTESAITTGLASYVERGSYSRLPPNAVEAARQVILDCFGAMIAGAGEPASRIVASLGATGNGSGRCSLIGYEYTSGAAEAGLVNGVSAHVLELDDTHHPGLLHPSAVLLPTILAIGEEVEASGRDLITAYLYGLDVMSALANGLNPRHYALGWHATGTLGPLFAAAAAAKLLDLDSEGIATALSIAASEAGGIRRNFGSMTKALHAGLAVQSGITAARLAERGFTAGAAVLEGERGFFDLMAGEGGWTPDRFLAPLDHKFKLSISGLAIKRFASCGATHPPIEAALLLRQALETRLEEVAEIEAVVNPMVGNVLIHHNPTTGAEGKFSLEHSLAVALVDGEAGLPQFTDARVNDPKVRSIASRVRTLFDPAIGLAAQMSWGARVTIRLSSGRIESRVVDVARGKWLGARLTDEEIRQKFLGCLAFANVERHVAEDLANELSHIEQAPSVGALLAPLRRRSAAIELSSLARVR